MRKIFAVLALVLAAGCASDARFKPFKDTVRACFGASERDCEEASGYTDENQYHKLYPIERKNLPSPDEV